MANEFWEFREFSCPHSNAEEAFIFLNASDWQGRGEATVPRKVSTAHTWYFTPHGVRDALTFLNARPRQGKKLADTPHTDLSAAIFHLEPGSR